ncbi:hypothetical protein ACQQ2N_11965 [Dokdonella sp. MW10]|uniref:hypothetical protein n=1 Tax=Dokdonella sp. MW10 TaxID=2992926 RepID=UPI003F7D2437
MSLSYVLAWLLPWVTGTGICFAVTRGPRTWSDAVAAAGTGFIVGFVLVSLLGSWVAADDVTAAFTRTAPWLTGIGVLAWSAAVALRRRRILPLEGSLPTAWRVVWWLAAAAIVVRLGVLAGEAWLRPTFPWDAWSAWAVKPKAWFLLGHHAPYVPVGEWLADATGNLRTAAIWDYPELLAWIQIWFASAAGGWNEPLVNLAWTGALAALALACYGHWRMLGLRPLPAIGLAYALVSLPLLGAHVALAGYADLWLAVVFGLATLSWMRWMRSGERAQLAIAAGLALCMPFVKLEGAVWLLLSSVVAVLALLPRRWRWGIVAVIVVLALLGIVFGGFVFPMLGLGWVSVSWGQVGIPALGELDLRWRPVGTQMLAGLLTLPNWHLLWYVVPLVLAWRWRVVATARDVRALAVLVAACAAFLFVLFFFTDASAWAENYTSANRLVLHLVGPVFTLLALLLVDAFRAAPGTAPAPAGPNAPA